MPGPPPGCTPDPAHPGWVTARSVGRCCGRPRSRGRCAPPTTPPHTATSRTCAGRPMSSYAVASCRRRTAAPGVGSGWGSSRRNAPSRPGRPAGAHQQLDRAGPLPLLAVAQLYRRNVPGLPGPREADLVLWCPFSDHGGAGDWDLGVVKWRRAAEVDVGRVLADQPEPPVLESGDFLPEPCVLHPEQVLEYPGSTCSRMSCNSGFASGRGTPGARLRLRRRCGRGWLEGRWLDAGSWCLEVGTATGLRLRGAYGAAVEGRRRRVGL